MSEKTSIVASEESMLEPRPGVIAASVGNETILWSQQDGVYYGLNPSAADVWRRSVEGQTFGEIHRALLREFDVEAARLREDLDRLVKEWVACGLVTVKS